MAYFSGSQDQYYFFMLPPPPPFSFFSFGGSHFATALKLPQWLLKKVALLISLHIFPDHLPHCPLLGAFTGEIVLKGWWINLGRSKIKSSTLSGKCLLYFSVKWSSICIKVWYASTNQSISGYFIYFYFFSISYG